VVMVDSAGKELSYEEASNDILAYYKVSAGEDFGAGVFGFVDTAWLDYPAFQAVKEDLIAAYKASKQTDLAPVLLAETTDDFVQGTIDAEELVSEGAILGEDTVEVLSDDGSWLQQDEQETEALSSEQIANLSIEDAILLSELEQAGIIAVASSEALEANAPGELVVKIGKNYGVVRYEGTQAEMILRPLSRDNYQASFEYGVLNLMNVDNNNEILAYYYDDEQKTSKEWVVLAQRPEERYEYRWLLENKEAYQVNRNEDGGYMLLAKDFPGVAFYIPPVYFIDAFGNQNSQQVVLDYMDGVFILRLLDQGSINFPIAIDPSVQMFEGGTRLTLNDDLTVNFSELPLGATVVYLWEVNGQGLMDLNLPFDSNPSVQPDVSGQDNHVLLKNGVRPELNIKSCVVGVCLAFDGDDDYVDSNSVDLLAAVEGSVELWVKPNSLGAEMNLLNKDSLGGDSLVDLTVQSDGLLSWVWGAQEIISDEALTANQWYQVVASWGVTGLKLSINGELSAESTVPAVHIAAEQAVLMGQGFSGYLDELRVYKRTLSSEQITVLFNDGLAAQGGPSRIVASETKAFEEWSLAVTLLASDGTIGVTVPADNTVLIKNELGLMRLREPAKEDENIISQFVDDVPTSSTVAYKWVQNPFTRQDKLMALNVPANAGETILDLSGNANNGIPFGSGDLYDPVGRVGGAMSFTGTDYVDLQINDLDFSGAKQGAIALWFKASESCAEASTKCVLYEYDGDSRGTNRLSIYIDSNDHFVWELFNGETYLLSSAIDVVDNKWHHLLANWNSTGMSLFVDAELDTYNAEAVVLDSHVPSKATIGASYSAEGDQNYQSYFQGWIDELQVYNRSLSLAQIQRLHADGSNAVASDRGAPTEIVREEHNYDEAWSLSVYEVTAAGEVGPEVYVGTVAIAKAAATDLSLSVPLQKTGDINFNYSCKNYDSVSRGVRVWYTDDAGEPNKPMTLKSVSSGEMIGNTIYDISCIRQGSENRFVWDSAADGVVVRNAEDSVQVKIEVVNLSIEESAVTEFFSVSNFMTVTEESYGPYNGESVLCDGGRLILNGEHSFGDLQLVNGCELTYVAGNTSGTKIKVLGDLLVDDSSTINVDALGCAAEQGYEAGLHTCVYRNQGRRLGLAAGKGASQVAAGGAYAGNGGQAGDLANVAGGVSQAGDVLRPLALGSGGGNSKNGLGGAGGGHVYLEVNGELRVDGVISSNGGSGESLAANKGGGGGAGGSVYLSVAELSGDGLIRANGGAAAAIGTTNAGGGGGGRVAIYFENNGFEGTVEAYGGRGGWNLSEPYIGGAGTVYWQDYAEGKGSLTVDNDSFQGQATPLFAKGGETSYQFEKLSVLNGAWLLVSEPGVCDPQALSVAEVDLAGGKVENSLYNEQGASCIVRPYQFENVPSGLTFDQPTSDSSSEGVTFYIEETGDPLFVLYPSLQLDGNNVDLSGLEYGYQDGKVFIHVPEDPNLAPYHDLYVPKTNGGAGVYICPEAINTVDEVNRDCPGKIEFPEESINNKKNKKVGTADKVITKLVKKAEKYERTAKSGKKTMKKLSKLVEKEGLENFVILEDVEIEEPIVEDFYLIEGLTGSGGGPLDVLITVSGTCKQSDNSTNCADGQTIRVSANGHFDTVNTGSTLGGTWSINNVSVAPGDMITVFIETSVETEEAVTVAQFPSGGGASVSGMQLVEESFTVASDDFKIITNAEIALFDNSVAAGFSMSDYVFHDVDAGGDLYVDVQSHEDTLYIASPWYRNIFAPGNDVYTENVMTSGWIHAGTNTIYVSGDWTSSGFSTFQSDTGTVNFTTTQTATISGDNSWYNFTSTVPGKTLLFESGSTQRIRGVLTLTGASGNPIVIDSTVDTSQWIVDHEGTESVSYVTTEDSGCDATSTDITTSDSADNGNTDACWLIPSDTTAPTGAITYDGGNGAGADFTISTEGSNVNVALTGTASDTESGVSLVEVSIDDGLNWNNATDTGGGTWSTWSYTATFADGVNQVRLRVTDIATNVQTYTTNSSTTDGNDGAQDITYLFLTLAAVSDYLFGEVNVDTIEDLNNTLSIRTNSLSGYQVQVKKQNTDPSTTMTGAGQNYPDLVDWDTAGSGTAVTWSSLGVGEKGLGFRIMQTGTDPNAYNSTYWGIDDATNAKFAGFPNTYVSVINDANSKSGVTLPLASELELQVESEKSVMATTYSGIIEINLIVNP